MGDRRQRRRRGFSLVEVLVSALILALGLVALSQLYVAAMWTSQKAHYTSTAAEKAQYLMEKVRDIGFNRLAPVATSAGYITTSTGTVHRFDSSEGYRALTDATKKGVEVDVAGIPDGLATITFSQYQGYPNLLRVDISVTWTGARRSQSDVRIATLLSNGNQ